MFWYWIYHYAFDIKCFSNYSEIFLEIHWYLKNAYANFVMIYVVTNFAQQEGHSITTVTHALLMNEIRNKRKKCYMWCVLSTEPSALTFDKPPMIRYGMYLKPKPPCRVLCHTLSLVATKELRCQFPITKVSMDHMSGEYLHAPRNAKVACHGSELYIIY